MSASQEKREMVRIPFEINEVASLKKKNIKLDRLSIISHKQFLRKKKDGKLD